MLKRVLFFVVILLFCTRFTFAIDSQSLPHGLPYPESSDITLADSLIDESMPTEDTGEDSFDYLGGAKECCVLKNTIKLGENLECVKGNVVGKDGDNISKCSGPFCGNSNASNWGMYCLIDSVKNVTNWIFYVVTLLTVLMIVYGGFLYITSAGDPKKSEQGKKVLLFSLIGLALALLANFIPSLVRFVLGV